MLATAARAIPYTLALLSCVSQASADLHTRSSTSHFAHFVPLGGAHKRQLVNDIACSLGVQTACTSVDTTSDVNNCGSAGYVCPTRYYMGTGTVSCIDSLCVPTCITGWAFDRSISQCVNLQRDARNCGNLGNTCSIPDGTASCAEGRCQLSFCNSGFEENAERNVCKAKSTTSDVENCGRPGNRCTPSFGATSVECSASSCRDTNCRNGYQLVNNLCSESAPSTSDPQNCGGQGRACPSSYENGSGSTCINNVCQPESCNDGYKFDQSISGCRQVTTDPQNCGAVGNVCKADGGVAGCQDGTCRVVSCTPPLQLTNGACTLGPSASAKARGRAKKRSAEPRKLCPGTETACPISGSQAYFREQATGFIAYRTGDLAKMEAAGGYECLDTEYTLESCGGCASMGEGLNCGSIPHSVSVACASGRCLVLSCRAGYKPSFNGRGCAKTGRFRRRHTKRRRH